MLMYGPGLVTPPYHEKEKKNFHENSKMDIICFSFLRRKMLSLDRSGRNEEHLPTKQT